MENNAVKETEISENTVQTENTQLMPEVIYDSKYGFVKPKVLEKKILASSVSKGAFVSVVMIALMLAFSTALQFVVIFTGSVGVGGSVGSFGLSAYIYYALTSAVTVISTGLPFFIYALASKMGIGNAVNVTKVKFTDALLLILMGSAICLAANFPAEFLGNLFEKGTGLTLPSDSLPAAKNYAEILVYFFAVAVLPPIFEEFAFRGVLIGSLRKYGDVFAIITSAFIFGFMHTSVVATPFAIIAGIVMGYIYVLTGNIWVNIGIHFANNAIATILDVIAVNCSDMVYTISEIVLFFGVIGLGLAALIILIVKKKLTFKLYKPKMMIRGGTKLIAAMINPGMIALFICTLLITVLSFFGL